MDGAVCGLLDARQEVADQLAQLGENAEAQKVLNRNGGKVVISRSMRKQIEGAAVIEGQAWINEIEAACRQILLNAHNAAQKGLPDVSGADLGAQMAGVIRNYLEPARPKTFASKSVSATSKVEWRASRQKRYPKPDAKRAQTLKRQSVTRMQTGRNRWYNRNQVGYAQTDPDIVYLQFSLGRAKNHTDICLARQGWIVRKGDPRLALNTPPLHYDCRSKWVFWRREAVQKYGIKRYTPEGVKDEEYEPAPGFGGYGG